MAVKTSRRHRRPLTRARVLEAALEMADEGGIEAISMRRLADRLGVEAMSLYHHVASKDEILGGIADVVVRQIELPTPDGPWKAALRRCAISAHHVLRSHPWACALMMSSSHIIPSRLAMMDAILGRLRDANLPGDRLDLAYHALDSHILGFTMWHAGYSRGMPQISGDDLATIIRSLDLDPYPHIIDHAAWHLRPQPPSKPAFEFGLDLILDGIEAPTAS